MNTEWTRRLVPWLLLAALAWAGPLPDPPSGHCLDALGLLGEATVTHLDGQLAAFEQRTGIRLVVAVLPEDDTAGSASQTTRVFRHWQLDQHPEERVALLVWYPGSRQAGLEAGYGLLEALPAPRRESLTGALEGNRSLPEGLFEVIGKIASRTAPGDPLATSLEDGAPVTAGSPPGRGFLPWLTLPLVAGGALLWLNRRSGAEQRQTGRAALAEHAQGADRGVDPHDWAYRRRRYWRIGSGDGDWDDGGDGGGDDGGDGGDGGDSND